MKPVIAITACAEDDLSSRLNAAYSKSILEAGGIPIIVPFGVDEDVSQVLSIADGLLLSGGHDVHPFYFGAEPSPKLGQIYPERDMVELALTNRAIEREMPIFGICRGIQLLNVALGGTLYQDIDSEVQSNKLLKHAQQAARGVATHYVNIDEGNLLMKIIEQKQLAVNSYHHQAINVLAESLNVVATSSDGIIEAVAHEALPFCLGVQWHPEELAIAGNEAAKQLFKAFVEASKAYKTK
ncbi:gamma-glutamyl-gamma-aminobutyrate hydrolase family protein [Lysinibacillus sp. NPDC096418]|uniref:gamma-glutamyl-gamma-aminobutyrate hydrolase family protein n=1 Tax=Lysinibacillus sp. NPDC096418 TaxID=3364138 RepID=UPI003808D2A0